MDNRNGQRRIYLYSHSAEAEKVVDSGGAAISTGGIRRSDGTMLDMAKPLSFTLDELKQMVSNDTQLMKTDEDVKQLSEKLGLSQEGMRELSRLGWLNNAAIGQVYSMTYEGFQKTLAGLEYISAHIEELGQYLRQKDLSDFKEKTDKFIGYLEADGQKLELLKFDVTTSNIDEHLNDIAAFIKRMYEGLMNGTIDGFFACIVINALIGPFADVMKKYAIRFFYDNGVAARSCNKWAELVFAISSDHRFREKLKYYIHLNTTLPYRDKVLLGKKCVRNLSALPNYIMFDVNYALYHRKEEYLNMKKSVQERIALPAEIPDDGKIYL